MSGYPGSKGQSGIAERIICQMRPHSLYVEPFLGESAVWRKKRFAAGNSVATSGLMSFSSGERTNFSQGDYRYLGDGWRERERIRRKTKRHIERLRRMPRLERSRFFRLLPRRSPIPARLQQQHPLRVCLNTPAPVEAAGGLRTRRTRNFL